VNKTDYEIVICEDNKTWDEIIELEKFWILYYGRRDLKQGPLVNLTNGGEGSYGRILSESTKKKIGEKSKIKKYDEQYRKKISDSCKGIKNHMYGKKLSEETKKKISESQSGDKHHWYGTNRPPIVIQKISQSQSTRKEVCKYDMDLRLIECYISVRNAAKNNNISQGNLTIYLNKPIITKQNNFRKLGGYTWKYKE
jgi:hypothetical protein